jgi:hypothetical protein
MQHTPGLELPQPTIHRCPSQLITLTLFSHQTLRQYDRCQLRGTELLALASQSTSCIWDFTFVLCLTITAAYTQMLAFGYFLAILPSRSIGTLAVV